MERAVNHSRDGEPRLRDDAMLMVAVVLPALIGVLILVTPRWYGYLGLLSAAFNLRAAMRRSARVSPDRERPVRLIERAIGVAIVAFWAVFLTVMIAARAPTFAVAVFATAFAWMCIGYGWLAGWLLRFAFERWGLR
jgi:hypothetical protein